MAEVASRFFRDLSIMAKHRGSLPSVEEVRIISHAMMRNEDADQKYVETVRLLLGDLKNTARVIRTSFKDIRNFAYSAMLNNDIDTLSQRVGGEIGDEVSKRLQYAVDVPSFRHHHLSTAADHYAFDCISVISDTLGLNAVDGEVLLFSSADEAVFEGIPYLCFFARACSNGQ